LSHAPFSITNAHSHLLQPSFQAGFVNGGTSVLAESYDMLVPSVLWYTISKQKVILSFIKSFQML